MEKTQSLVSIFIISLVLLGIIWFMVDHAQKVDRMVEGYAACDVVIPGMSGVYCQQRDGAGNIFYTNGKVKVVVLK